MESPGITPPDWCCNCLTGIKKPTYGEKWLMRSLEHPPLLGRTKNPWKWLQQHLSSKQKILWITALIEIPFIAILPVSFQIQHSRLFHNLCHILGLVTSLVSLWKGDYSSHLWPEENLPPGQHRRWPVLQLMRRMDREIKILQDHNLSRQKSITTSALIDRIPHVHVL